jgi:hypothetical protein
MMHELTSGQRERRNRLLDGRRILDTAEGILIGLRRCRSGAAFDELISAAHRHDIPVFAIAFALVTLASGGIESFAPSSAAHCAARCEWGELLAAPASSRASSGESNPEMSSRAADRTATSTSRSTP